VTVLSRRLRQPWQPRVLQSLPHRQRHQPKLLLRQSFRLCLMRLLLRLSIQLFRHPSL
jgi:hypothetical protein